VRSFNGSRIKSQMTANKIHTVIMCGGAGQRLWPLSRQSHPKHLHALVSDRTLLQETAARITDGKRFLSPLVMCNEQHRFVVAEQLRAIGIGPAGLMLEPEMRNTAPAIAAAAIHVAASDPDAVMLVLPADHALPDADAFGKAVETAAAAARAGHLVTFGIEPRRPETGYGYIKRGKALDTDGAFEIARFIEKPDRATAVKLIAAGDCYWNSGMFMLPVDPLLEAYRAHAPEVLAACQKAVSAAHVDLDFIRLDAAGFATSPNISVDYAIFEHTDKGCVVPAALDWRDLGDWSSLYRTDLPDEAGNVARGPVVARDTTNSYLRSEGPLLAVTGLDDMTVVAMRDAVLVADNQADDDLKPLVEQILAEGHERATRRGTPIRAFTGRGGFMKRCIGACAFRSSGSRSTAVPNCRCKNTLNARNTGWWSMVLPV
jgi:mannose-1-phosphate guanylyltransferase/mannose-6-phosphate isomerase